MVIKVVKTIHYLYNEYEKIKALEPYYNLPCVVGKYHYYFINSKNNEICSLVDTPDIDEIMHRGRYELCHPRNFFNTVEEAINFIEEYFNDHELEWINETDKSLSQPQVREMLGLPKER